MEAKRDGRQDEDALTGVFRKRADAENAYNALIGRGYTSDEITLMMSDETHKTHFRNEVRDTELGNKAMEKAGVGSAIGGTVGAIVGGIAGIGTSVALPGLGVVIAGPIVAALTGAGAGGLAGGVIGGLVGAGIPKERAMIYEDSIKTGGIVLGIVPRTYNDRIAIAKEWAKYHGESIYGWEDKMKNMDFRIN